MLAVNQVSHDHPRTPSLLTIGLLTLAVLGPHLRQPAQQRIQRPRRPLQQRNRVLQMFLHRFPSFLSSDIFANCELLPIGYSLFPVSKQQRPGSSCSQAAAGDLLDLTATDSMESVTCRFLKVLQVLNVQLRST